MSFLDPANPSGTVVLGLLTTALGAVLALAGKSLRLWIIDRIQFRQGRVAGTWMADSDNTYASFTLTMTLAQMADRLTGAATIVRKEKVPGGPGSYVREFKLEGRKLESFISITCTSRDPAVLAIIGGVFRVENQGSILDGRWVYRNTIDNTVQIEALRWRKQ